MKKLMGLLTVLAVLFVVTGCGNEDGAENVWTVGTSADYYPFEFIDPETEEIVGFDVDLINEIAGRLGYTVEMVDIDFTSLIPALQSGRVDLVIAGMTPTAERQEVVDFTDIYHSSYEVILTTTEHNINTLDDLNGLVVAVQSTTIQETMALGFVEDGLDIDIMSMNRIPELVQQLISGRADVVLIDSAVVNMYLQQHEGLQVVDHILETDDDGSAIALPLGSELTESINEVLAELKADGTIEALVYKWFN